MTQGNSSKNWVIRILQATAFAGLIAVIALVIQLVSLRGDDVTSKTQEANQAIQIAQQQTQIALANEQNRLQSQQLTLVVQQSNIEGQLLTAFPSENGNSSLTAIAPIIQATQIEATGQAIAIRQKGIEATQTAIARQSTPTVKLLRTELFDTCHSAAWMELSGFSPNSPITVTSNAHDLSCETGEWKTGEWTQVYGQPTDVTGYLVIAYRLGRGDYSYTFTDKIGQTRTLAFTIKP